MMKDTKLRPGMRAFVIENNAMVTEICILRVQGEFVTARFSEYGAMKLRRSRVFADRDEAVERLPEEYRKPKGNRSPYSYHYEH